MIEAKENITYKAPKQLKSLKAENAIEKSLNSEVLHQNSMNIETIQFKSLNNIEAINKTSLNRSKNTKKQQNAENKLVCPECGSTNFTKDFNTYELLCECGCVVDEDIIDLGPEWNNYENSQKDNSRVGKPKLMGIHDGGLSTDISRSNKGISAGNLAQIKRMRKWQKRSRIHGNKERHLATAFSRLSLIGSQLDLTRSLRESSAKYYRQALDLGLIHGRSIDAILASCIYISCKSANLSRTYDEISKVSNVKSKTIARYEKLLVRELNIKFKPTSPGEYVPRFVSNLSLSKDVEAKSLEILDEIKNKGVSGKPSALAAGSIYLACKILSVKISQETIAKTTGISPVTIRKRYKLINEVIN